MKKLILLSLFGAVCIPLLSIIACNKDIIDPPEGPLGYYKGEYIIEENLDSGGIPQTLITQFINWTFTDQQFWLEVDTNRTDNIEICDFFGFYILSGQIEFYQVTQEAGTCSDESKAEGNFTFIKKIYENAPDTMEFVQLIDSTRKTIKLVNIEECF